MQGVIKNAFTYSFKYSEIMHLLFPQRVLFSEISGISANKPTGFLLPQLALSNTNSIDILHANPSLK